MQKLSTHGMCAKFIQPHFYNIMALDLKKKKKGILLQM